MMNRRSARFLSFDSVLANDTYDLRIMNVLLFHSDPRNSGTSTDELNERRYLAVYP